MASARRPSPTPIRRSSPTPLAAPRKSQFERSATPPAASFRARNPTLIVPLSWPWGPPVCRIDPPSHPPEARAVCRAAGKTSTTPRRLMKRALHRLIAGLFASTALRFLDAGHGPAVQGRVQALHGARRGLPRGAGAPSAGADLVAEKTEGRIKIKVYPGTSLNCRATRTKGILTALRQGIIDMAVGSTDQLVAAGLSSTLFARLPDARPQGDDAFHPGPRRQEDVRHPSPSATWCRWPGARTVSARSPTRRSRSARPRTSGHEDARGRFPAFLATFNALGANLTQMSWPTPSRRWRPARSTARENPLAVFNAAKLHTPWGRRT